MKRAAAMVLFGVLLPMLVVAKPLHLRSKGGEAHEGTIKLVRNGAVFFQTSNGSVLRLNMEDLTPTSRREVSLWISKKGGTKEYASWIGTTNKSFSKSWPRTVYGPTSIQLKKRHDLSKQGVYVYESSHYRFFLNTKVEPRVVQRFAVLFEATYKYVLSLPINASGHYLDKGEKFTIYFFGDYASYHKAGGPKGSAGVYTPRNQSVLVPMPSLGVKWNGKKWEYVKGGENRVLSHELTHQLCAGPAFASWYIEGGAEYVAATRYTHGAYHASNGKQRVFDYVRNKNGLSDGSGRRLGSRISMMSMEKFMNLPYGQFAGRNANTHYGLGLLLTYYFYHVDGRGDGASIKKYIKAIQQGVRERDAQKYLLENRTYSQLQEDFRKFCSRGGISIEFR